MVAATGWALTACGPSNSASGTVSGYALEPLDAVFIKYNVSCAGTVVQLMMASTEGLCDQLKDPSLWRSQNRSDLHVNLVTVKDGRSVDLTPGTYSFSGPPLSFIDTPNRIGLGDGQNLWGRFFRFGADGNLLISGREATGGTLRLERVEPGTLHGDFELRFGSDTLNGTFDATFCDLPDAPPVASCQ